MPSAAIVLMTCGILILLMLVVWALQVKWINAAWADVVWAFATAGGGVALALQAESPLPRRLIVATLAAIWGLRLGLYMTARLRRLLARRPGAAVAKRRHGTAPVEFLRFL